jgi:hypothetical protein
VKREYLYVAVAIAAGALVAYLVKRARQTPRGNVEVGPAAPSVPYSSVADAGEHETVGGVPVVGLFGLDYS